MQADKTLFPFNFKDLNPFCSIMHFKLIQFFTSIVPTLFTLSLCSLFPIVPLPLHPFSLPSYFLPPHLPHGTLSEGWAFLFTTDLLACRVHPSFFFLVFICPFRSYVHHETDEAYCLSKVRSYNFIQRQNLNIQKYLYEQKKFFLIVDFIGFVWYLNHSQLPGFSFVEHQIRLLRLVQEQLKES